MSKVDKLGRELDSQDIRIQSLEVDRKGQRIGDCPICKHPTMQAKYYVSTNIRFPPLPPDYAYAIVWQCLTCGTKLEDKQITVPCEEERKEG